jgi:hypothetical protein
LVRHLATETRAPEFRWNAVDEDGSTHFRLTTPSDARPRSVSVWVAESEDRDLRDDAYTKKSVDAQHEGGQSSWTYTLDRPASGSIAAFFDLTYEVDGLTYHLSTPIHEFRADPSEDTATGESGE